MKTLQHITYFPNIAHMALLFQKAHPCFEVWDNYTKQTYRNRAYIYGANGKQQLNIPVIHSQKNRQLYRDVKIANETDWQSQHLKSLQSAYRTSPFYEFYEDDLMPLFEGNFKYLMDFNFACLDALIDCLDEPTQFETSEAYQADLLRIEDHRSLVNCKKEILQHFEPYTQVFTEKHGFISNLSLLDLLFNEGPNSFMYLERQRVLNSA